MGYNKNEEFRKNILEGMLSILQTELGHSKLKTPKEVNSINSVHKGIAFLKYYLYNFFIKLNDIDEDAIEEGLLDTCTTDGKNDKGCDFILIDGSDVYVIQSKYGYSRTEYIDSLIAFPENIISEYYYKTANNKLKSFISEIKKIPRPNYKLIYLTSERVDDDDKKLYLEKNHSFSNIELIIKDFSELRHDKKTIDSSGDLPPDTINFILGQEDVKLLDELGSEHPTILITQKGSKLKQLYLRNDCMERLFNLNIRSWLGRNAVNKAMEETIKSEPEHFFYYNNGITGICEDFKLSDDKTILTCNKLQIINGAQTVTTIAKCPNDANLSKVKVLFRIISAGKYGKSNHLCEEIVTNNNNQTIIQVSDFRSNDDIQIQIERKFKNNKLKYRLQYPFTTDLLYKRKRMQSARSNKYVTMKDIGKCYYSGFYEPHTLNESIKKLWDNSENGLYNIVFGDNDQILLDEKFYKLLGSYYIMEYIKLKLPKYKTDENKEDIYSEKFKYHILWGIINLLQKKYSDEEISNTILRRMILRGAYISEEENENKEKAFYTYFKKAVRIIDKEVKKIQEDKKSKDEPFVIRNYQRDANFTNILKVELDSIEVEDLKDLID